MPPWSLALGAMLSVQLGSALSVPLIEEVGAAGTAWLRLTVGALVFLAMARPPLRSVRRADVLPLLGLGVASGVLTVCSVAAIDRACCRRRAGAQHGGRRIGPESDARQERDAVPLDAVEPKWSRRELPFLYTAGAGAAGVSLGRVTASGVLGCHVALFRGLNVGQVGSPTRDELLAAFEGAASARSFQSNGTVLFRSDEPDAVARDARRALLRLGHRHELVLRPVSVLASLVEQAPAADPAEDVYRTMVSFYDLQVLPTPPLPLLSRSGLVEVRLWGQGAAVSACWKRGSNAGDVTGFLESLLGVPVTTRTLGTCERLVAASGSLDREPSVAEPSRRRG